MSFSAENERDMNLSSVLFLKSRYQCFLVSSDQLRAAIPHVNYSTNPRFLAALFRFWA